MAKVISLNPNDNSILGQVVVSTKQDVIKAINKARKTFPNWANMTLQERCNRIQTFIDISKTRLEEIATLIAMETGRPIASSRANVEGGIMYLEEYIKMAANYLSPTTTIDNNRELHKIYREPKGVIAAILPWNYPFMNVVWQCGQALIAGNTIVYKNSEEDILFSKLLEELVSQSKIPTGVFDVLYGAGDVGNYMVHQNIDMISFTGSAQIGKKLTQIAAEKFIPIVTELGGSSPMIIFDDVKITDDLIKFIADRRFKNAGQACDAVKRLIVHEKIFEEVSTKLTEHVRTLKLGNPLDEDTNIGPLISKKQLKLIHDQVEDAVYKGARVLIGGKALQKNSGNFYLPTVISNVKRHMRVWHEETFGPVLPIVSFKTEKDAIDMANDTEYGLTAHVITNDEELFGRVASKIHAGSITQNKIGFWNPSNPFGGYKMSGMGRIHGIFGFLESTNTKVVSMQK